MARLHNLALRPLALSIATLCAAGALAQTAPPAGSPPDVSYTPVQGLSSPLHPRQEADARPFAVAASPVGRIVVEAGRRLAAEGLLKAPADVFYLQIDEILDPIGAGGDIATAH